MFVYVDCSHDITWYSSPLFPQTRLGVFSWYNLIFGVRKRGQITLFCIGQFKLSSDIAPSLKIEKGSGGLSYIRGAALYSASFTSMSRVCPPITCFYLLWYVMFLFLFFYDTSCFRNWLLYRGFNIYYIYINSPTFLALPLGTVTIAICIPSE